MPTKKKTTRKSHIKQAKAMEWDDLAEKIIKLESAISTEKDSKLLESLKKELKIYETEKATRVFDSFDMQYFLSKDLEYIDIDMFTNSDI